ncbi:GGDEF domain-containing protein [Mycolicibacterium stellerae]|uniref:GGDEF domain-containing protein n=1 Tax=Mycolicibacterium stellerae TaxID=2358193 RepID=UPI000F0B7385|nr:GGDEF domain-containing protein [Mycolicibacterium stellerae]
MNPAQRWLHGLDHYYWLTAFLAARGLQKTTCRLVALVIFALSAISLTLIWSPTGPQGLRNQVLAMVVAVCCWGMTALWLRGRWPSALESRICVCLGSLCVAISCLIQADPLAGLFGATAFTLICIYAAVFHTTQWLTVSWVVAGATLILLGIRLAATDIAFAISSVLLVAFIVMFVSLTGKAAIWLVDADILHENFEPLTGLFNRDGFYEKATTLLASRSRGDDRFLAIAVVNLDTFSLVGEFSGLTGSNRARVEIAARLRETARRDAVLAHIADSEFVIGDLFESDDASALIERVRGTVSSSPSRLSASIGVVTTPLQPLVQLPPHDVLDELLSIATNAMYESRKSGGNHVTYVRSPSLTVLDDPGSDEWFDNVEPA